MYTLVVTQVVLWKAWDHKDWRINISVITDWGGNTLGVTQTNVKYSTGDTVWGVCTSADKPTLVWKILGSHRGVWALLKSQD